MEEYVSKKGNVGLVQFFFMLSVILCVFLYAPRVLVHTPATDFIAAAAVDPVRLPGPGDDDQNAVPVPHLPELDNQVGSPCSTMRNNSICCDRSDFNTDVCFMAGEVRTDAASLSLLLFQYSNTTAAAEEKEEEKAEVEERIRPYTRKWERFIMEKVQEVRLRRINVVGGAAAAHRGRCDVVHDDDAPLVVMTAGGYTGNFFHAFSDGFLPAWVTSQHLRRRVVLGVLSYNPWWARTFRHVIRGLSAFDVVDLVNDRRTHCFPAGAIVGTRFHGILTVDPSRLRDGKTVVDFHRFLAGVYSNHPREQQQQHHQQAEEQQQHHQKPSRSRDHRRPRLGIVSRRGTRVIENQAAVVRLAESVGFDVDVLETANGLPLRTVYAAVSACDALVGVHGADLTRFLFLRPRSSLTQISPLGVSPIARDCFGKPAERMGLSYEQYEVRATESSLSRRYAPDDVVLTDPEAAKRKGGWKLVAKVYLGGQNVTLDLDRFRHTLQRMHSRALRLQ